MHGHAPARPAAVSTQQHLPDASVLVYLVSGQSVKLVVVAIKVDASRRALPGPKGWRSGQTPVPASPTDGEALDRYA